MFNATPLLRAYAKYRLWQTASIRPAKAQERELLGLVKKAQNTKFGQAHKFSSIRSVSDFQARVPLRTYEKFWEEWWKPSFPKLIDCTWPGQIPYFPVSSGTSSGTTKFIPYSMEMHRSNTKASLDLLTFHLANCPRSQIFGGRSFILGGSTDLVEQSPGVWSGDLSGISVQTMPWWAKMRYFPPPELARLKDWEEKMAKLAPLSLKADIRMLSGVPAWLLLFVEALRKAAPEMSGRLVDFFPDLELLVHGGVNFAPYYDQFAELLRGSRAETREVYPASEGFIAVADRSWGDGLRLNVDHGIFFEFVPTEELDSANPIRHWVGNLEIGVNYAVVLTTCAGLWSYIIGDTVRFVDRETPRLLVTGRTSYFLSAFGEHLIGEEIDDAVSTSAHELGVKVSDYSVGAIFPEKASELGRHLYIIELSGDGCPGDAASTFSKRIDEILIKRNEDYEAHRAKGFGLNPPEIVIAKKGMFAAWMKSRGKLGAQNKVPRIINKLELFKDLREFCAKF